MPISENSKALSFPKSEKLKLKKQIETLFRFGKAFQFGHYRFIWLLTPATDSVLFKFGVSAPKKQLKKATQRNTAKRKIREAWRLQKHQLITSIPEGQTLLLFVIYGNNQLPQYQDTANCMRQGIVKLRELLVKH